MKNIIGSPFPMPPIDFGNVINVFGKIIDGLGMLFTGSSKEIAETDSISSNQSADNVDKIIQAFTDYKEQVKAEANTIEKSVIKEVDFYIEEIEFLLEENIEITKKYGINLKRIKRQIKKLSGNMSGYIDSEVSKKISLDNVECKEIVSMSAGPRKKERMKYFLEDTMKAVLDNYCVKLQETLDEIFADTEDEVIGTIDKIQTMNEITHSEMGKLYSDYDGEETKQRMENAIMMASMCEVINNVMEE